MPRNHETLLGHRWLLPTRRTTSVLGRANRARRPTVSPSAQRRSGRRAAEPASTGVAARRPRERRRRPSPRLELRRVAPRPGGQLPALLRALLLEEAHDGLLRLLGAGGVAGAGLARGAEGEVPRRRRQGGSRLRPEQAGAGQRRLQGASGRARHVADGIHQLRPHLGGLLAEDGGSPGEGLLQRRPEARGGRASRRLEAQGLLLPPGNARGAVQQLATEVAEGLVQGGPLPLFKCGQRAFCELHHPGAFRALQLLDLSPLAGQLCGQDSLADAQLLHLVRVERSL
mmetsp:Transcript_1438/g.4360  ORF Transcript_1438/g.4360 Transcript_1438/m.4360 type:complete len:286 (-) Transcript_1438:1338-2195(-)